MGKKTVKSNIHVKVYPFQEGDFGMLPENPRTEDQEIELCEEIAKDIRRHVINLPSPTYDVKIGVTVNWDNQEVCEHCGAIWNPTCFGNNCCDEDERENGFA